MFRQLFKSFLFFPYLIITCYAQSDIKYDSQQGTNSNTTNEGWKGTKPFTVNNGKNTNPLLSDSALLVGNNTNINDSTKLIILKEYTNIKFKNKRTSNRYYRLLEIVKKVYPLAKLAGKRMEEYAAAVDTLKRGQIDDLVAQIEDEIKTKYGADLKKLGFREGIILLKLLFDLLAE